MQIRTFDASTLGEAQSMVRTSLGDEALILSTEPLDGGIRITAAIEPEDDLAELLRVAESGPDPRLAPLMSFHGVPAGLRAALAEDAGGDALEPALARALETRLRPAATAERRLFLGLPGHGKTLATARRARALAAAGTPPTVVALATAEDPPDGRLDAWLAAAGIEARTAPDLATLAALARTPGPLLVDAPGISPVTSKGAGRLRAIIEAVDDVAATLVLSVEGPPTDLLETAADFVTLGCRSVLPTKLDLARRYGGLVALACGGVALLPASVSGRVDDAPAALRPAGLAKLLVRRFEQHVPSTPTTAEVSAS
jgi:flagellar biosynthesis protein FlhF